MTETSKTTDSLKSQKSKGPIRWEAILPFTIIVAIIYAYFHLFFDLHFKKALEFAGYHALGAEVNITTVETSVFKASLKIERIQITNADNPSHNMLEIGEIRFSMLWDALLRGKVVINESVIEQIAFDTKRSYPGRVKPPEADSNEPSLLEKEGTKLAKEGLEKAQTEYSDNVLGDVAAILSGTDSKEQLKLIEGQIKSKARMAELEKEFKEKEIKWKQKIESLPNAKTISSLGERLKKVKTKNFKTPQELQDSIKQIQALGKEAEDKLKEVQTTGTTLNTEVKTLDAELKELENMIKQDIKDLEARMRLPQIDGEAITKSLLARYTDPYLKKVDHYHKMATKYLPPNLLKKDASESPEEDIQIQPRPRASGISYEFGKPNSYPVFWLKTAMVSSKSHPENPMLGDLKGQITNITSNQPLIGKPTVFSINGDFPGLDIHGLAITFTMDHVRRPFKELFEAKLGAYPVGEKEFVNNKDVKIGFAKATGSSALNVQYSDSVLNFDLKNEFKQIAYDVSAKNTELNKVLAGVFNDIPMVNIMASGSGVFPKLPIDIRSNLGPEMGKAIEKQIQQKIAEVKAMIEKAVNEAVAKEKAKLDGELKKLKMQIEGEVKKAQDQLNKEKKTLEAKVKETQKQAEKDVKKTLETEGKKKLQDLKKQLGL